MYDYHIHSHFSGDCDELMENIVLEAIKKGGKQICFTDHLDYDYPDENENFDFDEVEFDKSIKDMQNKYKDEISIKKGIEIGLQTHIIHECNSFINRFKPDFVLCSFHCSDKKDFYNGDFFIGRDSHSSWDIYLDEVIEVLNNFDNYSVVGHLDIIKRYNDDVRKLPLEEYKNKIEEILKIIISKNKGIEVNMSGLRSDLKETLPEKSIIEMYYELGGKIITIGSDSHYKEHLYSHYKETLQALDEIGFETFTIFDNMKPEYINIKEALDSL